ncbi:MAG: protein adenylyltransferase SelO family protein [Myxococcota bacterium]
MPPRLTDLLQPDRLDRLDLVGVGFAGRVLRAGRYAVKVAHPTPECRRAVAGEVDILDHLQDGRWGIAVPRLHAVREDRAAFVRDFLDLPCLLDLLRAERGRIGDRLLDELWLTYRAVEAYRRRHRARIDFTPANLYYHRKRHLFLLADLGERGAPHRFGGLTKIQLRAALRKYVPWRAKLDDPHRVRRVLLPPSGRFHVDVPVGRLPDARILWLNRRVIDDLDLRLDRAAITGLGSFATHADPKVTHLPATLYQDSPLDLPHPAKGDGRALYVGTLPGGPHGRWELMLKGCGPTPLRWTGNPFHEDGLVSFPRALWETTIADELARLGFETPQNIALLSTGRSTIDNTQREWPAVAALRISSTHYRLAHLKRWEREPEALRAFATQIGRNVLRPDFNPDTATHLNALVLAFSGTLGFNTGRTDALNIHGFNPTPGNVRINGHFIDYSTIRFMRWYLPDYLYLDNKRTVREHRACWRQYCTMLVQVFETGGLLASDAAKRLSLRAIGRFNRGYNDGYLAGLSAWLGCRQPLTVKEVGLGRARALVEESIALRKLRAEEHITFDYWQQRVPAPLFDLEGRMPRFVAAWQRGRDEPWRLLRSEFSSPVTPFAAMTGRTWLDALEAVLPPAQRQRLKPRRWRDIFRPFVEAERLASLTYGRATPEDFKAWKRAIASRW